MHDCVDRCTYSNPNPASLCRLVLASLALPCLALLPRPDHRLRLRSGMCLQQTDLTSSENGPADGKATKAEFVVSLFGARDDIKAHYTADRARICGATWEAFLGYAGATVEDVWGGVNEADRKLWSVSYCKVRSMNRAQS